MGNDGRPGVETGYLTGISGKKAGNLPMRLPKKAKIKPLRPMFRLPEFAG
jgi:hypothetical protein